MVEITRKSYNHRNKKMEKIKKSEEKIQKSQIKTARAKNENSGKESGKLIPLGYIDKRDRNKIETYTSSVVIIPPESTQELKTVSRNPIPR
jgi:hypothetical protein